MFNPSWYHHDVIYEVDRCDGLWNVWVIKASSAYIVSENEKNIGEKQN